MTFCDHCGEVGTGWDAVTEMPVAFHSGNAGESAVLCPDCMKEVNMAKAEAKERTLARLENGDIQHEQGAKRQAGYERAIKQLQSIRIKVDELKKKVNKST